MKVLIIGGTNFIGPYVLRRLADAGHEIIVFHRGRTEANLPPGVGHILGDRQRLGDHADVLRRFAPEVVLDMIPFTKEDAHGVMETFGDVAERVVAISSMDVYRAYGRIRGDEPGPPDPVPLAEDSPLREKLYPYRGKIEGMDDYEKILVERMVMGHPELPGTVLRLPMVYGPGDSQHRLFPYIKRMDDRRPAILLDEGFAQIRASRGYVENVAIAIALAVVDKRAASRVYNVAELEAPSEAEWVRIIGKAARWEGEVLELPHDVLPVHLRRDHNTDQHWVVDTTRIRRELGYQETISREETLQRTVAWERAHPPKELSPDLFNYAAEDAVLQRPA